MPPLQADRLLDPCDGLTMAPVSGVNDKDRFKIKCVMIGDGATGKTSLILSYSSNAFPTEYIPTAYDTYSVDVSVDHNAIRLELCDTAGQDDFDHLRPLCYPGTDVFLLCFSVVNPTSFHNINEKWVPEVRKKFPNVPLILVGTLCDLRDDVRELIQLDKYNERPVSEEEAEAKASEIGAMCYIECSALTQKNMKEVFDTAIFCALEKNGMIPRSSSRGFGSKRWKKYRQNHTVEIVQRKAPSENGNGIGADVKEHKTKKGWKKFCCFA